VSSIGLNELVTHSHQAYEDTAIRIANNADLHQDIRSRLERQRAGSGLFDTPAFCRHLEALYTQIWYEGQLQRGSHIQRSTR